MLIKDYAMQSGTVVRRLAMVAVLAVCATGLAEQVRQPVFAGSWYPSDKTELTKLVDRLLQEASPPTLAQAPIALISPHAGIRFSGPVAACGYKALPGQRYETVIVLAISHRTGRFYRGASVPAELAAYQTPLGRVPVDQDACRKLLANKLFRDIPQADRQEHSLEIQLPFLQRVLGDFRLVPVLVGQCQQQDYDPMARALAAIVDDKTLLVASTDFTHYGPNHNYVPFRDNVEKKLIDLADAATAAIVACDLEGFTRHITQTGDTICGRDAVSLLLRTLQLLGGADGVLMGRDMSGRIVGSFSNSVTYVSVALTAPKHKRPAPSPPVASQPAARFSPRERRTLLRMARQAVTQYLKQRREIDPRDGQFELTPKMLESGAAFVTLRRDGRLRGCIGETMATRPLVDSIVVNAIKAATQDARFADHRISLAEMKEIELEVSVMSPLRPVASVEQICLGRDGVALQCRGRGALYLPQVADETGWSKEIFLSRLAMKAGLPAAAWKQPGATFHTFTAEVFCESEQPDGAAPTAK